MGRISPSPGQGVTIPTRTTRPGSKAEAPGTSCRLFFWVTSRSQICLGGKRRNASEPGGEAKHKPPGTRAGGTFLRRKRRLRHGEETLQRRVPPRRALGKPSAARASAPALCSPTRRFPGCRRRENSRSAPRARALAGEVWGGHGARVQTATGTLQTDKQLLESC